MTLLGRQMPFAGADGNSAGSTAANEAGSKSADAVRGVAGENNRNRAESAADGICKNAADAAGASPQEAGAHQPLPESARVQEDAAPRFTPDMPVEEILARMTLEEAGKVVVDTGVCKGQTLAEVAQRRPPSLKFYRYGGYKGDNNILRAAAQIMLDSMEAKKAG